MAPRRDLLADAHAKLEDAAATTAARIASLRRRLRGAMRTMRGGREEEAGGSKKQKQQQQQQQHQMERLQAVPIGSIVTAAIGGTHNAVIAVASGE